jgi:prolyl 4-hydroxylase
LKGGGPTLKKAIWDAAITGMEEWTGGLAKLRPVSLYGIREYTEGAVLSPHVDRVPLVSSGIVNVAQDVDEDWPLEVYDRNGHAVNITMKPGDMILYESHSLIHGRPFPLKGRYFANVFIHFEPFEGWEDIARDDKTKLGDNNGDLPPYILKGSPEEENFRESNPNGWSKYFAEGEGPPVSQYAADGLLQKIKDLFEIDPRLMWLADENGWKPLHEACRYGHMEVVQFLIDKGAGVNDLTGVSISFDFVCLFVSVCCCDSYKATLVIDCFVAVDTNSILISLSLSLVLSIK